MEREYLLCCWNSDGSGLRKAGHWPAHPGCLLRDVRSAGTEGFSEEEYSQAPRSPPPPAFPFVLLLETNSPLSTFGCCSP